MDAVRRQIEARRQDWIAAVNAGDVGAYAELVTPDVVWLPPVGSPVRGRAAFRAWLEPFMGRFAYDFSLATSQVRPFEGFCAEAGSFRSVMSDRSGGGVQEHGGAYCVLWRRDEEDGVWRIERYVDGFGAVPEG